MDIINKNKAVVEAIKEVVRLAVLAIVAWAITEVGGWNGEVAIVLTGALRAVDKWIHENPSKFNGLLPF